MESTPELAAEGVALVRVLSAVLDRLVSANAPLAVADPGQVTKFHALKAPGIGVRQYLERIHKYASCSNECFVLALIYIDRLIQRNNFLLTELNVHRVVITAILLAAKFFDDAYYNNAYYAKVGGVLVSEMNGLEVDFLFRINFSLHVTPELFHKYRAELSSHSVSAGVQLPPMSAAHSTRAHHHTEAGGPPAIIGGHRMESAQPRPMQTEPMPTSEKRSVGTTGGAFITPSPPSSSAKASALPSDYSSTASCTTMSTDSYPYHQQPVMNMVAYPASSHHGRCSSDSRVPDRMDTDEKFMVVDNVAYPVQVVHHQHQPPAPKAGSLGKLLQNYQASARGGYRVHPQSDPQQHLVGGRNMLTGVSSGM